MAIIGERGTGGDVLLSVVHSEPRTMTGKETETARQ